MFCIYVKLIVLQIKIFKTILFFFFRIDKCKSTKLKLTLIKSVFQQKNILFTNKDDCYIDFQYLSVSPKYLILYTIGKYTKCFCLVFF